MPVGWAIVVVVQWVVIIALAAVVLGVLRQLAPHLERLGSEGQNGAGSKPVPNLKQQGPAVGTQLPALTARNESGELVDTRLRESPSVVLILSGSCAPCLRLAQELGSITADRIEQLSGSLFVMTDQDGIRGLTLPAWVQVLQVSNTEISEVLGVSVKPFALAVDADGIVRNKRLINTLAQLDDMAAAVRSPALPLV